ncbi:MAG: isoaspartyl peptidase/L-asparaginase [Chitinophagaceae bacterium]|nr:MAG: isoaspartyl peptidase/L-asparaginase [Chitinophagaceae bacterium]
MRTIALVTSLLLLAFHSSSQSAPAPKARYVLVIHGGAGTILKSQMTPEKESAYQSALEQALAAGEKILAAGGRALDAVEASVRVLEDNPLFNAGKGAVFTNAGKNELDAAIMDGSTLKAGAVAGVTTIRNPVSTARAVMERSEHVMLTGKGAEDFAATQGQALVDPSYFYTEARWQSLLKARSGDSLALMGKDSMKSGLLRQPSNRDYKYGTVGAVALDQQGNLAAATSTGGMTNKKFGRVGDAPIIGAGTYANNNTVAISGTGWGEYYIRLVMAKTISDMMEYGKTDLKTASNEMVMKRLPAMGGDGGLIAVDKDGNIALPFCTEGMYRGYVKQGQKKVIAIYKN